MAEDEIAQYERATRRRRAWMVGGVIAAACSPFAYCGWTIHRDRAAIQAQNEEYRKSQELSERERGELRTLLGTSAKLLTEGRAGWAAAVTPDALARVSPDGGACPIRLRGPDLTAGDSYTQYGSIDGNYFGDVSYSLYAPGVAIGPSPTLAGVERTVTDLQRKVADDEADKSDLRRAREELAPDYTVFIVGTRQPALVLGSTYTPGRLAGTAYIYSYPRHAIVCVGELDVANSSTIDIRYSYNANNPLDQDRSQHDSAEASLHRDLDVRVRRALASDLQSARVAP